MLRFGFLIILLRQAQKPLALWTRLLCIIKSEIITHTDLHWTVLFWQLMTSTGFSRTFWIFTANSGFQFPEYTSNQSRNEHDVITEKYSTILTSLKRQTQECGQCKPPVNIAGQSDSQCVGTSIKENLRGRWSCHAKWLTLHVPDDSGCLRVMNDGWIFALAFRNDPTVWIICQTYLYNDCN